MSEDKYAFIRLCISKGGLNLGYLAGTAVQTERLDTEIKELLEERDRFFRVLEQYAEDPVSGGMARAILEWAVEC